MLYKTNDPKVIIREIKKLQPLNYNQFMWWRRFTSKVKPLPKQASFIDKIKNGEYEFSHYFWQAQFCELEINEKMEQYKGDIQKLLDNDGVSLTRRKRLWIDFEKTENELLRTLKKGFLREFVMTDEEYEEHITNFDGTTEEFYMYCLKTFERSGKKAERRGRPPKK
jgi:hypothetical protein